MRAKLHDMNYSYSRIKSVLLLASLLGILSCDDETRPILPELPEEIRYLSLQHNSSSNTIVNNGTNAIRFEIVGYDVDRNRIPFLSLAILNKITISINESTTLGYPFLFTTTENKAFNFEIKDVDRKFILNEPIKINTIEERSYEPIIMQIIFHYISAGITELQKQEIHTQLKSNIALVNKSFNNLLNSTDPNAASAFISFKLAEFDPDGNALEQAGLHEIFSNKKSFGTFNNSTIDELIWDNNFWSPKRYINVWIADLDNHFSWAYYPDLSQSSQPFPRNTYGVIYNKADLNNAMTLTHELGHMLNLMHVFENTCFDTDFCNDTWAYKRDFRDTQTRWYHQKSTCDNKYFVSNNFMDYYPSQNNTFSLEQVMRMQFTLSNCSFLPIEKNTLNGKTKFIPYSNSRMDRKDDRPLRVL